MIFSQGRPELPEPLWDPPQPLPGHPLGSQGKPQPPPGCPGTPPVTPQALPGRDPRPILRDHPTNTLGSRQMPPCKESSRRPKDPPRSSPEITRAVHSALVENRLRNSQAACCHQPSVNRQQRATKPWRLFLQPLSFKANVRTDQKIPIGFPQHSASGMRRALDSPARCHKQGAGRVGIWIRSCVAGASLPPHYWNVDMF